MTSATSRPTGRPESSDQPNLGGEWSVFLRNVPSVVVLALVMAISLATFSERAESPAFISAAALTLGSLACSFANPWARLPVWCAMVPALMLIAAIGALTAIGFRVSIVALIPLIDLARHHGRRGSVVGVILALAASQAELIFTPLALDRDEVLRLVILPVVFITVTAVVNTLEERAQARVRLMVKQGHQLTEAYDRLDVDRTLLRGVVSGMTMGVVVLDGADQVVIANDAFARYGSALLTPGVDVGPLLKDESSELGGDLREYLRRAVGDDRVSDETRWWTLSDGTQAALRANVVRVVPTRARGTFRVLILEDLTTEVSTVREREEFVGAVSHELRTPLTSVLGYLELAMDDDEMPESSGHWLAIAERNVRKLDLLVGDLLADAAVRHAFSTSGTDGAVAIGPLISDTLQSQRPRAERAEVHVDVAVADDLIVRGDAVGVGQVLDNLLSNAIKYSNPGGHISVVAERVGDWVEIRVADEGIGIAQKDQERLFERFFRAEAVRSGERRGTGLGLHLVREIVAAHSGEVELTSELGVGTEVRVRLPRARRQGKSPHVSPHPDRTSTA